MHDNISYLWVSLAQRPYLIFTIVGGAKLEAVTKKPQLHC